MHIYKFRLLTDIDDEFIRDIEIQANQTFEDFHNMISKCVNLNGKELASFHICDQKWNKFKEITLIDMQIEEGSEKESKPIEETFCMKNSLIKDFIEEPHQRLLYEYDFFNMNTFFIELQNVHKQKDNESYPRCTFSKGELLPDTINEPTEKNEDELKKQLLKEFNDLLDDTYDYKGDSDDNTF
ncbi:MAG: hypothetical protein H8D45_30055 [Bacteroidetes bacterium]|nr:hypothetical protein [Bacteroidota bacterium]MBL7105743.1 hypothetical protein [Bacteroidales bacterium]